MPLELKVRFPVDDDAVSALHPDFQHQGIERALVRTVTNEAVKAGCEWERVDYEPHLADFYEHYRYCGFRPTPAGLRSARNNRTGSAP